MKTEAMVPLNVLTATVTQSEALLLHEASSCGVLVIPVFQARDLVRREKRRHDAAERLRCEGLLRRTLRLGERRTVHGDQWAEYVLTPKGRTLLRQAAPPRRPLRTAVRALLGLRSGAPTEPDYSI